MVTEPRFGWLDAHQGFHQRGLAHAVAAHDRHDLVGRDRDIEAMQHLALAVGDVKIGDCQHRMLPIPCA
jgi:hypothetical protein